MGKKALKYAIAALFLFISSSTKISGCPTCEGRVRLGVKKPFFEMYRPKTRSKYIAQQRDLTQSLSFKQTETQQDAPPSLPKE